MKKFRIGFAVLALGLMSFVAATNFTLDLDKAHSHFGFTIKHLGISDFNGQFTKFDTKLTATADDLSDAKIEFSADAASINTGIEQRDNHLRSADLLDTEKYPEIKFVSTSVKKEKGNNYKVEGDFTFHGVTKKVALNAVLVGKTVNPQSKKEAYGIKFTGAINRLDYGVGAGFPEPMLSNEIKFTADLEFAKSAE